MSLILDALRKSEAERRRGEAPSLYASLPTPGTRRRPTALRFLPWIVIAILAAVALFVLNQEDAPATRQELPQSDPAPAELDADAADTGFETAAAVAAASQAKPPAAAIAPAAAPPPPGPPAPTVDALVKPPPGATAPSSATATPAPPAAATSAIVPPTPPGDVEEPLPPVAVLDTSTRSTLPALKLSMHFYSSEPERRFAIIDGQRVTEGMQLGAAVVTQIRRDGVVLDVNGRRVLLPRP